MNRSIAAHREALRHPISIPMETPETILTDKDETTGLLIQTAIDIHRTLGRNHAPEVYRNSLAIQLTRQDYHVRLDMEVPIYYREFLVGQGKIDLAVADYCLLSIISDNEPDAMQQSIRQMKGLLKSSGFNVGLILNFGMPRMIDGIKRVNATPDATLMRR